MSQLRLQKLSQDKLTIEPVLEGSALTISLAGTSDSFAVKALGLYLGEVTEEVGRLGLTTVAFDVTKLGLLNSSSLKQFITFLRPIKLGTLKFTVEFLVDDQIPWQRRCLAALVRMCPIDVSVRDINGGAAGNGNGSLPYAMHSPSSASLRRPS